MANILHLYDESIKISQNVIGVLKSLGMERKTNPYITYVHNKQQTSSLSKMMSLSWLSLSSSSFSSPLSSMCRNKLVKSWMAFASFKVGATAKDGAPYPDMSITSENQSEWNFWSLQISTILHRKTEFPTSCALLPGTVMFVYGAESVMVNSRTLSGLA